MSTLTVKKKTEAHRRDEEAFLNRGDIKAPGNKQQDDGPECSPPASRHLSRSSRKAQDQGCLVNLPVLSTGASGNSRADRWKGLDVRVLGAHSPEG